MTPTASARHLVWLPPTAIAAACAPSLLAFNVAPSATFLNQALALLLWSLMAAASGFELRLDKDQRRTAHAALVLPGLVLAGLALAAVLSHLAGSLPRSLMLSALATLAAAAVLTAAGAQAGATHAATARKVMTAFGTGWLLAGLLNVVIASVQTLAPQWADGTWIARSALAGRAVGNLRQPNHVCTLLLWAAISSLALLELRRLPFKLALPALALLCFALVLTASRTALLGVVLLALWGAADSRLSRPARGALLSLPVLYALAWGAMALWSRATQAAFGAKERLAEADVSASRFDIWRDCLELIRQQPWQGVGFGEFNFAWSLTELPKRPVAFFDHAHNLFLQWAVELGLPASLALSLLLLLAAWRMVRALGSSQPLKTDVDRAEPAIESTFCLRFAMALLAMMLLHSQLEYPLWYAYFLLPTTWLLGFGLAQAGGLASPKIALGSKANSRRAAVAAPALVLAGSVCAIGAVASVLDYTRVVAVFDAGAASPLHERLRQGRDSLLFSHHAAYAAATISREPAREMEALREASHNLLDTRLMTTWARASADSGDLPRAQYLAARLREFRNPLSAEFFAPCDKPGSVSPEPSAEPPPFQCLPLDPRVTLTWKHFR